MAGITLTQAETALNGAIAAHAKVLNSQEYEQGDARNKRVRLEELLKSITYWQNMTVTLSRTSQGARARRVIPLDI